jgi:hypothetical protein
MAMPNYPIVAKPFVPETPLKIPLRRLREWLPKTLPNCKSYGRQYMGQGRDLTTEADIEAALERARLDPEPDPPFAICAEYDTRLDLVILHLDNGHRLVIPRENLQGLENATEAQRSQIEIFGGYDVAWPQLDLDHYLPALLKGIYGSDKWMQSLERRSFAA